MRYEAWPHHRAVRYLHRINKAAEWSMIDKIETTERYGKHCSSMIDVEAMLVGLLMTDSWERERIIFKEIL